MPKRPRWSYEMNKRQVEENEESMFRQYIRDIKQEHPGTELSYFERNLEVSRETKYKMEDCMQEIKLILIQLTIIHLTRPGDSCGGFWRCPTLSSLSQM
jgi:hypothetical protein